MAEQLLAETEAQAFLLVIVWRVILEVVQKRALSFPQSEREPLERIYSAHPVGTSWKRMRT